MLKNWLLISLALTIISISWMTVARRPLVIPQKTNALFSLETAFTPQRVANVRETWINQLSYAEYVNNVDFFFVCSYSLFFLLSVLFLRTRNPMIAAGARTLLALTLITFVLDIFEGVISHYWLKGWIDPVSPPLVAITAILKFVFAGALLVLLTIAYLQWMRRKLLLQKTA